MATITQFLKREVSTDAVAITCTQALCFVTSVFILALGSWKLSTLDLVGHQIFCGLLLTGAVSLLLVVLGLLLPTAHAAVRKESK
jgi:hypothetical protein